LHTNKHTIQSKHKQQDKQLKGFVLHFRFIKIL
jgi:hypothetical protein